MQLLHCFVSISIVALLGLFVFTRSLFLSKRRLPQKSECSADYLRNLLVHELQLSERDILTLVHRGVLSDILLGNDVSDGCWMERRVSSIVMIIVDALRYDLAEEYLHSLKKMGNIHYKFIADPPTVTRQRLLGLTTGGLPTFGDIMSQFGSFSSNDDGMDDSWLQQLVDVPLKLRGYSKDDGVHRNLAFVGDDTWIDIFPSQFNYSFPYPSFNTRDLDTVDNGCFSHLPYMLQNLRSGNTEIKNQTSSYFELAIAHTLGIDHVGHTFGPFSEQMKTKYAQTDKEIEKILNVIDESSIDDCRAAIVFGDHGMSDDGNHGGGTENEVTSAFYIHFSAGCEMEHTFEIDNMFGNSINQIDLVPTLSLLLGLPIPFASIGTVVSDILPLPLKIRNKRTLSEGANKALNLEYSAVALALNAAQVWHYFKEYEKVGSTLISSQERIDLESILQIATRSLSNGVDYNSQGDKGSNFARATHEFRNAENEIKHFLRKLTDIGRRKWTEFNVLGMCCGITILTIALVLIIISGNDMSTTFPVFKSDVFRSILDKSKAPEQIATILMLLLHSVFLTFSNSYIDAEQKILMFALSIICLLLAYRLRYTSAASTRHKIDPNNPGCIGLSLEWCPIIIIFLARIHEELITGHGIDSSLKLHTVQHPVVFILSSLVLIIIRVRVMMDSHSKSKHRWPGLILSLNFDSLAIIALCVGWWYKRKGVEFDENSYLFTRIAFVLPIIGICAERYVWVRYSSKSFSNCSSLLSVNDIDGAQTHVNAFRLCLFLIAVTGSSAVSSVVIIILKVWSLYVLAAIGDMQQVPTIVISTLWKFLIRHTFFATGHACSLGELQLSAAFVATNKFYFVPAGMSLFLNTFGWDILGLILCLASAKTTRRYDIWLCLYIFQLIEILSNCISVIIMRRHLMMWATFAPRFVFAAVLFVTFQFCWMFSLQYWLPKKQKTT